MLRLCAIILLAATAAFGADIRASFFLHRRPGAQHEKSWDDQPDVPAPWAELKAIYFRATDTAGDGVPPIPIQNMAIDAVDFDVELELNSNRRALLFCNSLSVWAGWVNNEAFGVGGFSAWAVDPAYAKADLSGNRLKFSFEFQAQSRQWYLFNSARQYNPLMARIYAVRLRLEGETVAYLVPALDGDTVGLCDPVGNTFYPATGYSAIQ